ncbi:hypothetical protein RRG08_058691 [Elysia crispata]|uniref:Uncharacterized protein n=1 Tax=Elysia crispata TaxID=231223 RepID=A0AAE0YXE5_9GAST|nr:hypothetical protein RRG08_058691 [Elysia crispata]
MNSWFSNAVHEVVVIDSTFSNVVHEAGVMDSPFSNAVHEAGVLDSPFSNAVHEAGVMDSSFSNAVHEAGVIDSPFSNAVHEAGVMDSPFSIVVHEAGVMDSPFSNAVHEAGVMDSPFSNVVHEAGVMDSCKPAFTSEPNYQALVTTGTPITLLLCGDQDSIHQVLAHTVGGCELAGLILSVHAPRRRGTHGQGSPHTAQLKKLKEKKNGNPQGVSNERRRSAKAESGVSSMCLRGTGETGGSGVSDRDGPVNNSWLGWIGEVFHTDKEMPDRDDIPPNSLPILNPGGGLGGENCGGCTQKTSSSLTLTTLPFPQLFSPVRTDANSRLQISSSVTGV